MILPLLFYLLHFFPAADQRSAPCPGYGHFVAANIAPVFFSCLLNCHFFSLLFSFLLAGITLPLKFDLMVAYLEAGLAADLLIQLAVYRFFQVEYPTAFATPEMIMVYLSAFIPAYVITEAQSRYPAAVAKQIQITVNGAFTDTGYDFPGFEVNPVCTGVRLSFTQYIQYGLALPCMPSLYFNNISSQYCYIHGNINRGLFSNMQQLSF